MSENPPPSDEESESGSDQDSGDLALVFTAEGQCVLEEDGEPVWMSDDDDDFQEEFGNEFLDPDEDGAKILNWLMDEGFLEEEERNEIEIVTESNTDSLNEPENENEADDYLT